MKTYGSPNLTAASPAQSFTEPISIEEAVSYLKLPPVRAADQDALLGALISGAREIAEGAQGRDLVRKQWDLSFDYWPACEIELGAPLVTVDLVRYRDSEGDYATLAEGVDYIVDTSKQPGVIAPMYGQSWPGFTPWPSSAVLVRFTSGLSGDDVFWLDSGKRLKVGMFYLISEWFMNRRPFYTGPGAIAEYPYAIQQCLTLGAIPRVS